MWPPFLTPWPKTPKLKENYEENVLSDINLTGSLAV